MTTNVILGINAAGLMQGTVAPGYYSITLVFDGADMYEATVQASALRHLWAHQLPPALLDGNPHTCRATAHGFYVADAYLTNAGPPGPDYGFTVLV